MILEGLFDITNKRRYLWFIAWLIALGSRLIFPLADPPPDLSWSGGYYADEGFWVHNARNDTLFAASAGDEWNNKWVSPIIHYPVKLLFHVMGAGLRTVRIWGAMLAVVTLIFLDRITRRLDPGGWLFLLFSVNSTQIAYQRTAILESAILPFAAFTMWVWLKARESQDHPIRPLIDFATGIAAALTWQIKATQIYFLPLIIISTWMIEPRRRKAWSGIFCQIAGMSVVALGWLIWIRIPNQEILQQYYRFYLSQQGQTMVDLLKNLLMQPPGVYFNRMPVLLPACVLMTGLILVQRQFRLQPPAIMFSWVWLLLNLLSLAPMGYRPLRYYLPAVIPMIILGHRVVTHRETNASISRLSRRQRILICALILLASSANLALLADRYIFNGRITGISNLTGFSVTSAILTIFWSGFFASLLLARSSLSARLSGPIIIFCIVFQAWTAGSRLIDRSYQIVTVSRDIARILPAGSVLAGQWAPELVLETSFRAIPVWQNFVNWKDPFNRYSITHVLSWEYPLGNELDLQKQWFPEVMAEAYKIKTYTIKNSPVTLWQITDGDL